MMLSDWLEVSTIDGDSYNFQVTYIGENEFDKAHVCAFCAEELISAFRSWSYLQSILRNHGFSMLSNYIEENVFAPDGTPTWFGDFGEVLCTAMLRDFDCHTIPICKIRYRESQNWAMRLTDILTYREGDGKVLICFSEIMTRTTRQVKRDSDKAKKDYKKLKNTLEKTRPEIIDFIKRKLYEQGEYAKAALFEQIYFGKIEIDKYSILFFVYEPSVWDIKILSKLNDEFDPAYTSFFEARVIFISDLRDLIQNSYDNAKDPLTLRRLIESG